MNSTSKASVWVLLSLCLAFLAPNASLANSQQLTDFRTAIQKVLDEDTRLGAIRNHNPETMPIHLAIEKYSKALRALNYEKAPVLFKKVFTSHIRAWEKTIPEFKKYSDMRGELHGIFDTLRGKSISFPPLEKAVWDTWRDVETVVNFYQSELPLKSFVFSSNRDGNSEIYQSTFLASNWKNLTRHPESDNWPIVSSDRKKLLFQSRRNGKLDVYLLDLLKDRVEQVTYHADHDYLASFGNNNDFVYFTSWRANKESGRKARFFRKNLKTGLVESWTSVEPGNSTGVSWHGNPAKALTSLKRGENTQLFFITEQGKPDNRITDLKGYNAGGTLSPDGKKVAFYSSDDEGAKIGVIELSNQLKVSWLISKGYNWNPHWSDDGKWIAFSRSVDQEHKNLDIFIVEIANPNFFIPIIVSPGRDAEFQWLE